MRRSVAASLIIMFFFSIFGGKMYAADVCDNFYDYERLQCYTDYPDQTDWHYSACMDQAAQDYIACKPTENAPSCYTEYPPGSDFGFTYCNVSLLIPKDKKTRRYLVAISGKLNYEQLYGSKSRRSLDPFLPLHPVPFVNGTT